MRVKKVLYGIIVLPVILILILVEWLLKLLIKISTIAAGILINVLLVCILIAICTKQWDSAGILVICTICDWGIVFGQATILNFFGRIREYIAG